MHVLVVGGGIFGLTAALELRARGHHVTLVDPGQIPHPLAESTDISKVVRADYGNDALYTGLMELALEGWRRWNAQGGACVGLFHECGVMFVCRKPMTPGHFEHESYAMLTSRGHRLERLDRGTLSRRFPTWNGAAYVDGYFNPMGGYAESGKVVAALAGLARALGVVVREGVKVVREERDAQRTRGVTTEAGETISADTFVFTMGAWAGTVLSDLAPCFLATGHPVLHLSPSMPSAYVEERFPVFGADISQTGLYGFPLIGGVVKVASHGPGRVVDPWSAEERRITAREEEEVRAPLREALPGLGDAAIATTRICVYGDTHDGDLWIAPDPERPNRVVATGGSGHAFKLAPVLGALIADACEGTVVPRFRWRPEVRAAAPADATRHSRR